MKSWFIALILLIFVFFLDTSVVYAQPGDPPGVPLGGLELLIAAGAAFGAKKWFEKNKKKE